MKVGFEKFMMNARDNGLTFAVFNGKRNLDKDQLSDPIGNDDIRIAPIIIGSKSGGIFQTILGAVMVVVGAYTQNYALVGAGIAQIAGGVYQMLSPQTPTNTGGIADTKRSYYFDGAVNSSAQGDPVPYGYGRMRIGSKVISSGIYSEDQV
jgi:predicted phage tail protein